MQTDELRAELTELANEVDPFSGDVAAIRRRVARRRMATSSVALVLAVALVVGVVFTARSGSKHVHVAGRNKVTAIETLPRVDALIELPPHATNTLSAEETRLDAVNGVEHYALVPRGDRGLLFGARSSVDTPERRALMRTSRDSTFLAVELDRSVPGALRQLESAVGNGATVFDWNAVSGRAAGYDIEIFMAVKACTGEIDGVRAALSRDPDLASFRFMSHEDALREFKRLFSGQPALIKSTTAAALPTSFRLEVRDGVVPATVGNRYARRPGVDAIILDANPFAAAVFPHAATSTCSPQP